MKRKLVFKNIKFRFGAILIFAVCSLIVWNWNSRNKTIPTRYLVSLQPQPETIFQDRDISAYDFGGQIVSCFNNFDIPAKDCQQSKKQAREFIYKHWQDRKRAYLILECSYHCSAYYVFVEPNKNGNWNIVWRSKYSDFERGFSSNISNEEMTSVVYKIATEDNWSEIGIKLLSFQDKDRKEKYLF